MNHYREKIFRLSTIILSLSLVIFTGCSEENPLDPEKYNLELITLITNPICPQPGDTTTLSVRISGYSSGPWPSYFWEVNAGSLLVSDEAVVEWIAPEQLGDYRIKAQSSLGDVSDVCSLVVSVRNYEEINTGERYNLYPNLINGTLFFVSSYGGIYFESSDYISANIMRYISPGVNESITDLDLGFRAGGSFGGDNFVFSEDGQQVVASVITSYNLFSKIPRKNIAKYELFGGGGEIVTDQYDENQYDRCDQYRYPFPNSDATMVVMQEFEIGTADDGTKDFFNISFWNESIGAPVSLTNSMISIPIISAVGDTLGWRDVYFENTKPVFTPDEAYIIYFCDSSGTFEPSMIPMNGGQPNISALMVFDLLSDLGINISPNQVLQWEPDGGNRLAFIAPVNNKKTLCFLEYTPGSLNSSSISVSTTDVTGISEFVWSTDGSGRGAVITETGIYIVGSGGEILTEVMAKERSTDMLCGVNWSPDCSKIGFRMGRMAIEWNEAFSALMVYSLDDDWVTYVTKGYPWPNKQEISEEDVDFRWRRVVFESDNEGLYGPVTIGKPGTGEGENPVSLSVKIVHSWK